MAAELVRVEGWIWRCEECGVESSELVKEEDKDSQGTMAGFHNQLHHKGSS